MKRKRDHRVSSRLIKSYKGFSIIKVVTEYFHQCLYPYGEYRYDDNWIKRKTSVYNFCKEGDENKPSKAYIAYANTIEECENSIDKFIEDDSLFFTEEERKKYVYDPNRKCNYAYGYDSLMKLMKTHKKSTKRIKVLIEDRLTDANFHAESGLLSENDYEGFIAEVRKTYKFREKFEIMTETECKRIDNPQQFIDGLAKVVEEYLASQGVKDTTAKVRFIEDW